MTAGVQVADDGDDGATGEVRHKPSRSCSGFHRQLRVHSPPEPLAGIGHQSQQTGGAADVEEVEVGRFQEDIGRCLSDFALQSPHHASYGYGTASVGDEQHLAIEGAQLSIEGLHLLAGAGATHDDGWPVLAGPGAQDVVVEGVQRLPQFQHHVVGDVHYVVDGAHASAAQPHLHPEGRGFNFHAPDEGR